MILSGQSFSKDAPTGVMTYCFIRAIEFGQANTYGSLLSSMRAAIQRTATDLAGGGGVTSLLNKLLNGGSLSWALRQVSLLMRTLIPSSHSLKGVLYSCMSWPTTSIKFGWNFLTFLCASLMVKNRYSQP